MFTQASHIFCPFSPELHAFSCWFIVFSFPDSSVGKESVCNAGDPSLIPGSGRSPVEGKGYPLQSSGLENAMDCTVHGVAKPQTWLSNFHYHFPVAQWQGICLQCRSHRRHRFDPWVRKIPWRRAWKPTPIFLPGESHRQRNLVGYIVHGVSKSHAQVTQDAYT